MPLVRKDLPEPGTDEARGQGCTCRMSIVHSTDIDPPEPVLDKWCPVHGRDPDLAYEEWRDRQYEKTPFYMEDDYD
jgi:hypothetical protein